MLLERQCHPAIAESAVNRALDNDNPRRNELFNLSGTELAVRARRCHIATCRYLPACTDKYGRRRAGSRGQTAGVEQTSSRRSRRDRVPDTL